MLERVLEPTIDERFEINLQDLKKKKSTCPAVCPKKVPLRHASLISDAENIGGGDDNDVIIYLII